MIRITPIAAGDLPEVGRFLNVHLNKTIASSDWTASLSHRWAEAQPNHGMQLRDDDRLVGVFCAIYSDQWIDGRLERFCNPHSWCVLNEYRNQSIGLILPLLKQPGYHFTMYTPNPRVTEVFRGLKFRELDNRLLYFPNLPARLGGGQGEFATTDPDEIGRLLKQPLLRDFTEHRSIKWLNFVAFGREGDLCLAVYKHDRWKRMPCARILHISDASALQRYGAVLRRTLWSSGYWVSRIEARFVASAPGGSLHTERAQPKLVLTKSIPDSKVFDLYSELAALDV